VALPLRLDELLKWIAGEIKRDAKGERKKKRRKKRKKIKMKYEKFTFLVWFG
jgi:hypothetical protein